MDTSKLKKLSPHDTDSEKAALGCLLVSEMARVDIFSILEASDFYHISHQEIYKALESMHLAGEIVDPITAADYLKRIEKLGEVGGKVYIHSLMASVIAPSSGKYYAQRVKDCSQLRKVQRASQEIYVRVMEGRKEDISEFKSWAQRKIFDATVDDSKSKLVKFSSLGESFLSDLSLREEKGGSVIGATTGFKTLDSTLSGLQKKKLYIIAARTSIGKSSFVLNMLTKALKDNVKCLLFSLEEGSLDIYRKIISVNQKIDSQDMVNGRIKTANVKVKKEVEKINSYPLYYYDSMTVSIDAIRKYTTEAKYKWNIDLVVVDYIQLVECKNGDNREQKVAAIARGLKTIAADCDVIVIGLSQFNRNVKEDKKPTLSDLRESGAIEQDADVVISLSRYGNYDHIKKEGQVEVRVLKNRTGPLARILFNFYGKYTKFEEIDLKKGR
jgi:replicative DNA helicase